MIYSKLLIMIAVVGVAAAALGQGANVSPTVVEPPCSDALKTFLASLQQSFGDLDSLSEQFGEPTAVEAMVVENIHSPSHDDVEWRLRYEGADFTVREIGTGRRFLVHAEITTRFAMRHQLPSPKDSRKAVMEAFGPASRTSPSSLTFECPNDIGVDTLEVRFEGVAGTTYSVSYFLD